MYAVCEDEKCSKKGTLVNILSGTDRAAANVILDNFGTGAEDPEDFCQECGQLGILYDEESFFEYYGKGAGKAMVKKHEEEMRRKAMGDELKGKIEVVPGMTLNVDLTTEHLVDLQVNACEENLLEKEKEVIAARKAHQTLAEDKAKERRKFLDKIVERRKKAVESLLLAPLRKAGFNKPKIEVTLSLKSDGRLFQTTGVGLEETGGFATEKKLPLPKEVKRLNAEIEAAEVQVRKCSAELMEIKTLLSNIDRMERKARAVLAAKALESTPAGKRLLADLKAKATPLLPNPDK